MTTPPTLCCVGCEMSFTWKKFGSTRSLPRTGRPAKLSSWGRKALVRLVTKNPEITGWTPEIVWGYRRQFQDIDHCWSPSPIQAIWPDENCKTHERLHSLQTAVCLANICCTAVVTWVFSHILLQTTVAHQNVKMIHLFIFQLTLFMFTRLFSLWLWESVMFPWRLTEKRCVVHRIYNAGPGSWIGSGSLT